MLLSYTKKNYTRDIIEHCAIYLICYMIKSFLALFFGLPLFKKKKYCHKTIALGLYDGASI